MLVSEALEAAGIVATLSGGGAVSIYARNEYESWDLDFVTTSGNAVLAAAIRPLGFRQSAARRLFEHPATRWLVEFPPGPLAFGDTVVADESVPVLATASGRLRVVTPTLCVIDRLAAYYYHHDAQCWDQAVMVARHREVDWGEVSAWVGRERQPPADVARLRRDAGR